MKHIPLAAEIPWQSKLFLCFDMLSMSGEKNG